MVASRRFVEVSVCGGDLAVWCDGAVESASAVFLLLHDATANARVWDLVMDRLPEGVAAVAPDLRGRGASAELGEPQGATAVVDDLIRVLGHFGLDQVGVVAVGSSVSLAHDLDLALPGVVAVTVAIEGDGTPDPFIEALDQGFPDRPTCHQFWQRQPVFAADGQWNAAIQAFLDHGLAGSPPWLRPRADPAAVAADLDHHQAAPHAAVTRRVVVSRVGPQHGHPSDRSGGADVGATHVSGIAPVSALLSPAGADAVAGVIRSLLSSPG